MITRVRYFAGQVLGVAELETEQRYVIERLRRRNRWLHGWGIVAGLRLSIGPKETVVAPGFALDCLGNEIEIEAPTRWPLRGAGRGTACYLTLTFAERAVDPGPVIGEPSNGGDEPAAYTRVEESWALAYATEDPARGHRGAGGRSEPCDRPHGIALARLLRAGSRWRVDPRYRPGRVRA
jgi:hypothetical protein